MGVLISHRESVSDSIQEASETQGRRQGGFDGFERTPLLVFLIFFDMLNFSHKKINFFNMLIFV